MSCQWVLFRRRISSLVVSSKIQTAGISLHYKMETAIVAAAIPYIVTAAQILGGISGGLNIIDHFSHKPDPTKKILAAVAEAETHILDAIHTETLNEHLLHISTAETWWRDTACKDIFDCRGILQSSGV